MGYGRSWTQSRKLTMSEWARLTACVERIQRIAGVDLAGPMGVGKPLVTRGRIAFNGAAQTGEDYETFELMPTPGIAWPFVKTERRPYDAVVAAVLTAADRIAPGAFAELTADGGAEDWAEADAICDYIGLPRRKRIASRASVMAKAMDCVVRYTGSGVFDVTSPSGRTYTVSIGADEAPESWACGCEWAAHGGGGCCHARAVDVWLDQEALALDEASRELMEVAA